MSQEVKIPLFYRASYGWARASALSPMETATVIYPATPEERRALNTQVNRQYRERKIKR